jgi:uncharacterized membrane protein YhhN
VWLAFAAVACVVDWAAVQRQNARLEYVAKPLATLFFLLVAASAQTDQKAPQVLLMVALVCCILGDVFLVLPRDAFVPGLASFAVAQLLLTASFAAQDPTANRLLVGIVVAVPVVGFLARRFVGALLRFGRRELVAPVVVYMVVITLMVVSSVAGGTTSGVVGAIAFMASDSLIAETRFVRTREWHGVAIMVTYHLALAGLVIGLAL